MAGGSAQSRGISVFGAAFLTFLVLLVLKTSVPTSSVRGWPWWLVTLPLWCIPVLVVAITALILASAAVLDAVDYCRHWTLHRERHKRKKARRKVIKARRKQLGLNRQGLSRELRK